MDSIRLKRYYFYVHQNQYILHTGRNPHKKRACFFNFAILSANSEQLFPNM